MHFLHLVHKLFESILTWVLACCDCIGALKSENGSASLMTAIPSALNASRDYLWGCPLAVPRQA